MTDSFPRQQARTQGFSLGVPRSFEISPDGGRVAFLRSQGGDDPVTCLWVLDAGTGQERLAADPAKAGPAGGAMTDAERAIRERMRERAAGITGFATDTALTVAAFALAGRLYLADLTGDATPRAILARAPAFDPRPDPAGRRVAYVCEGALRVTDLATGEDSEIIGPGGEPGLSYGLAEFIAAEEMSRTRGYWWAPDGTALLVARVASTPVRRWYICDPANPDLPAAEVAYPAAGTPNADVTLVLAGLDGSRAELEWDRAGFPYLVTVNWDGDAPLIVVESRDQRRMRLLSADPARAATAVLREDTDDRWLDIVPGVPARTGDGRIVWTMDAGGARRLLVATPEELAEGSAEPVTPADLQVRDVLDVDSGTVLFSAWADEPTEIGLWTYGPGGLAQITAEAGVHHGRRAGGTTVIVSRTLAEADVRSRVVRDGSPDIHLTSLAARPLLPAPRPDIFAAATRGIRTALLLPSWHEPGSRKLPVLLDPYGGAGMQRVTAAWDWRCHVSQWFAEQGFAVLVADGRGTPGRGPDWERAVYNDLFGPVLEDQLTALHEAAAGHPDLDLNRVGIRGWSFSGALAAYAVLHRPDVFHAAVAGAGVTDQRLYNAQWRERFVGEDTQWYERGSLIAAAPKLTRPLLLIHGLDDDNVHPANTLRLSAALLAAGRPHEVLLLPGVGHHAIGSPVTRQLLEHQARFLLTSI